MQTNKEFLIEQLKSVQLREGLIDREFAESIGIHRISWVRIKTNHAGMGRKFLQGVRQAYPELKDNIDIFLFGDMTAVKTTIPIGKTIPTFPLENQRNGALRRLCGGLYQFVKHWRFFIIGK